MQFLGGDLTNIVRDGNGNVIAGDVSDLSMRWNLIAFGSALKRSSRWTGCRSTVSLLRSRSRVVMCCRGPPGSMCISIIGGTDILVAYGEDRTLTATAVPEPTSAVLAGLAVIIVAAVGRKRRTGIFSVCKEGTGAR